MMNSKSTLALLLTLIAPVAAPLAAQSTETTPGQELSDLIFGSIGDGSTAEIDMGQFVDFGRSIFTSIDSNEDGAIAQGEFIEWDFGFEFIADEKGRQQAFQAARNILFANWDRNSDGTIDLREYHRAMAWDYRRADTNDDAFLSREEFLRGYTVIKTYRAALSEQ
ncbi:signal transduction protein [Phaeobacter inhibens]|uniref:signal transduction protein n=1 Tax=Phaeobacter inhibens TaxID=221822 RepID=UPI0021A470A5|nr:signal transduction protein [Phaeobacter inhibens]UWR42389.1 signal transduction protein [Phaeobacter inhibens]UWR52023.1 signal transduction protein [Phaeobacter inhibens]UWR79352.1 signal transduction protein [Phaeobacter inhibens]UWR83486.1 signal transduction protein [Phaeobacter inhibens]